MADEHDGTTQFEAEANAKLDADLKEAEREAARLRAIRALQDKDPKAGTVIDSDGEPVGAELVVKEPWPYGTLEYRDHTWEYRIPKPLAAMFLGAASRKKAKAGRKIDAIMGYLEHVLSEESLDYMMEIAQDHDNEFDTEHMAELVRLISAEGSSRPTGSIQR